jgi:hypothetical protein
MAVSLECRVSGTDPIKAAEQQGQTPGFSTGTEVYIKPDALSGEFGGD